MARRQSHFKPQREGSDIRQLIGIPKTRALLTSWETISDMLFGFTMTDTENTDLFVVTKTYAGNFLEPYLSLFFFCFLFFFFVAFLLASSTKVTVIQDRLKG